MRHLSVLLSALVLGILPGWAVAADTPAPLTEAQKAQIEDVIREFLTQKEPETVLKAVQKIQSQQEAEAAKTAKTAVSENHDKLHNDPDSPVAGNPKGDVTVIEFFDYQCGYCKVVQDAVVKLLQEDKNVKFIYKEFPILGPSSIEASKAALASVRQGKYIKFHNALMDKKEHLTREMIDEVAKSVGLNVEKLRKDMESPEIEKMLSDNLALGSKIGARGTPMFIFNDKQVSGAIQLEKMKQEIAEARKNAKK